jgi:hypothetical protein
LSSRLSRGFEKIMGGQAPILLIFGGLGVGLVTEGFSKWFDHIASGEPVFGAVVTFGAGLICFILGIVYWKTSDLFSRFSLKPVQITLKDQVEPHQGLIVISSPTNGNEVSPAEAAIRYHIGDMDHATLRHCWILAGPDTPGNKDYSSYQNATHLKAQYESNDSKPIYIEIIPFKEQDNVEEIFNIVDEIYLHRLVLAKLEPNDVITDFTGGTKSMSVGMALAGFNHHTKLEIMKPQGYKQDGRADRDQRSIPIQINTGFIDQRRKNMK